MTEGTARVTRRRLTVGAVGASATGVGALGAVGLAVACGQSPGSAERPPAAAPAPATLQASNWIDHAAAMQPFMQEFPTIKVEYAPAAYAAHYEKVRAASVAGTPIDVFWLDGGAATDTIGSGFAMPLDDLVKRDKDAVEDVFPVALKYHTRAGKLYTLPQNLSVFMLYVDQDRFAEAGVPLPTADWTLDALTDAAQRITRSGSNRFGLTLPADRRGYWMFVKAHGGGWTDDAGTRSRLADAETIAGVQFVKDLLDKTKIATRPQAGTPIWGQLQQREAGMLVGLNSEPAWNLRRAQLTFRWDLAEPPRGARGRGTLSAATGWAISPGGKQLDAAWRFAKWMAGEPAQRLLAAQNAIVPSRKKVVEDPAVNPPPPANLKATSGAHAVADLSADPRIVLPTADAARLFDETLNAALADVFADRAAVKDALTAADAQVKAQGVFR